jgi:hypothetical protein
MKLPRTNILTGFILLVLTCTSSACSLDSITAQKSSSREDVSTAQTPTPEPTPNYKPLKRVSRDVLDTDKKDKKDKKEKSARNKTKR